MCTISWLPTPDGYQVRMNRDEHHSRAPGEPPAVFRAGDLEAIAPMDPDGGGTWIGVNEAGLTLALANVYPTNPVALPLEPRSRGLLVMDALASPDAAAVDALIRETDLLRLRPFQLLAFEPSAPVWVATWDGRALSVTRCEDPGLVATSSSRDQKTAEKVRRSWFNTQARASGGLSGGLLDRLHRSRHPQPGPWAVSMERSDAATVSMSAVTVGGTRLSFVYTPGPPHRTAPSEPVVLPRTCLEARGPRQPGT